MGWNVFGGTPNTACGTHALPGIVLAHAGCSLHRDSVDARLIDEVKSYGTRGKIIHSESESGGIGELKELHAIATYRDN